MVEGVAMTFVLMPEFFIRRKAQSVNILKLSKSIRTIYQSIYITKDAVWAVLHCFFPFQYQTNRVLLCPEFSLTTN